MRMGKRATVAAVLALAAVPSTAAAQAPGLWQVYNQSLRQARYIDLTHEITPNQPVWKGFGPAVFKPSVDPVTGEAYTYAKHGFEATAYALATDQFGTQLDPPAHWAPEYPGIDELPPTYAVRPLVVISIVPQVKRDPKYALQVTDIRQVGAAPRPDPARLGRDGALRLVEEVDRRPGEGEGARRRPDLPGRRPRRARSSSTSSATSCSTATSRSTRTRRRRSRASTG